MSSDQEFSELVERHLRNELDDAEREQLAQWLDSDPELRRSFVEQVEWDTRFAEVMRASQGADDSAFLAATDDNAASSLEPESQARRQADSSLAIGSIDRFPLARILLAIAAIVIAVLGSSLYSHRVDDRPIARITGLSGSLRWTGDRGLVESDLAVGTVLTGGTVEGMTPNSWVELEFDDGSTVTISGNSMLTFSDQSQKELHVRDGKVAANVRPQPPGKPMLIHTRSATLEVLGTQLRVEADLTSTTLNVTEGRVRMTRLTDGVSVEVPARHRVIASADHEMSPQHVPDSITHWQSQLPLGPQGTLGKWTQESPQREASLKAIPFVATTASGDNFTIYAAGFGVSRNDGAPVILRSDSKLRIRGRLGSKSNVFFGVTVNEPEGEFAGKYQVIEPMLSLREDNRFDVVLDLNDFRLDPTLASRKDELPADPIGSVVDAFWCHTLSDPVGLEIYEVALFSGVEP